MKLCVIGDPHFANHKIFGRPTPIPGCNTRLKAIGDAFTYIGAELGDDINHAIILGDITHNHGVLTPSVWSAASSAFWDIISATHLRERILVTLISGNHDIDAHGQTILYAFQEEDDSDTVVSVAGNQQLIYYTPEADEWIVYGISYRDHESTMKALEHINTCFDKKRRVVLCMHHHFDGAQHGAHEFQPPGGLSPKDIPDCVELVLTGHYHKRQWIGDKILYVGAPVQHTFGEATYTPGYTIVELLDGKDPKIEFHEIPAEVAPRFHILPYNLAMKDLPGLPETDYYRIDIPHDQDMAEARRLAKALTNVMVRVIPSEVEIRSRVEKYLEEKGLESSMKLEDIIEVYAAMNADPSYVDELVDLGLDIANTVLGGSNNG